MEDDFHGSLMDGLKRGSSRVYAEPTQADQVRELLRRLGLGQRAAADKLEIHERTMRGYCAGDKVPRIVIPALERLVDLDRRIAE